MFFSFLLFFGLLGTGHHRSIFLPTASDKEQRFRGRQSHSGQTVDLAMPAVRVQRLAVPHACPQAARKDRGRSRKSEGNEKS